MTRSSGEVLEVAENNKARYVLSELLPVLDRAVEALERAGHQDSGKRVSQMRRELARMLQRLPTLI